jgi:hypothetical protein
LDNQFIEIVPASGTGNLYNYIKKNSTTTPIRIGYKCLWRPCNWTSMTVYKLVQSCKTTIKKTLFGLFMLLGYGTRIPKIIYSFVYVNLSDKLPCDSSEWSAQH